MPALIGAPLRWLGASAMLTYNLLVLVGLTLTALAIYGLIVGWTGDPWAGVLAGAVPAFSTAVLTRIPQLQALHLYALPLTLLAFDRLIRYGRSRDAVLLGLAVLCAALTSGYLVVFVTVALGGTLVARAPELRPGVLLRLTVAAVVTLGVGLALLSPYLANGRGHRDPRCAATSRRPRPLHYELRSNAVWHDRGALFPGVVALVLAGVALRAGGAPRGVRRMLVAIAAVGGPAVDRAADAGLQVGVPPDPAVPDAPLRAASGSWSCSRWRRSPGSGSPRSVLDDAGGAAQRSRSPRWRRSPRNRCTRRSRTDPSSTMHQRTECSRRSVPARSSNCHWHGAGAVPTRTPGTCWRPRTTGGRWWPATGTSGRATTTTWLRCSRRALQLQMAEALDRGDVTMLAEFDDARVFRIRPTDGGLAAED